jgi:hypothetical protein
MFRVRVDHSARFGNDECIEEGALSPLRECARDDRLGVCRSLAHPRDGLTVERFPDVEETRIHAVTDVEQFREQDQLGAPIDSAREKFTGMAQIASDIERPRSHLNAGYRSLHADSIAPGEIERE